MSKTTEILFSGEPYETTYTINQPEIPTINIEPHDLITAIFVIATIVLIIVWLVTDRRRKREFYEDNSSLIFKDQFDNGSELIMRKNDQHPLMLFYTRGLNSNGKIIFNNKEYLKALEILPELQLINRFRVIFDTYESPLELNVMLIKLFDFLKIDVEDYWINNNEKDLSREESLKKDELIKEVDSTNTFAYMDSWIEKTRFFDPENEIILDAPDEEMVILDKKEEDEDEEDSEKAEEQN